MEQSISEPPIPSVSPSNTAVKKITFGTIVFLLVFSLITAVAALFAYDFYTKKPNQVILTSPSTEATQSSLLNEKKMVHIKSIYEKNGKNYLDVSYIEWLTGEAGLKACIADGKCTEGEILPNDYYEINIGDNITSLEVSNQAKIENLTYSTLVPKTITFAELQNIFSNTQQEQSWWRIAPYNIELGNNLITKISQQYQP